MTGSIKAGRRSLLAGAVAAPEDSALAQVPAPDTQPAPLQVAAIGSLTVGGCIRTHCALPVREARMTASGPVRRVDENGDFMVGQMYVQCVRLCEAYLAVMPGTRRTETVIRPLRSARRGAKGIAHDDPAIAVFHARFLEAETFRADLSGGTLPLGRGDPLGGATPSGNGAV